MKNPAHGRHRDAVCSEECLLEERFNTTMPMLAKLLMPCVHDITESNATLSSKVTY